MPSFSVCFQKTKGVVDTTCPAALNKGEVPKQKTKTLSWSILNPREKPFGKTWLWKGQNVYVVCGIQPCNETRRDQVSNWGGGGRQDMLDNFPLRRNNFLVIFPKNFCFATGWKGGSQPSIQIHKCLDIVDNHSNMTPFKVSHWN